MTLVVDASVVAAALLGAGSTGEWAEQVLLEGQLAAPHLLPVEVANILRRAGAPGQLSRDAASLAYDELREMPVELFPYGPVAARIWELREDVTPCDAWYVALAESLQAELVTLDLRLSRAAGPRCRFRLPPYE